MATFVRGPLESFPLQFAQMHALVTLAQHYGWDNEYAGDGYDPYVITDADATGLAGGGFSAVEGRRSG